MNHLTKPNTSTFFRYQVELGKPDADMIGFTKPVDGKSTLIPLDDCHRIEAELHKMDILATPEQASLMAQTLLSRYPQVRPHNPDIYINEITKLFTEIPYDICEIVMAEIRESEFPPNTGTILKIAKPLMSERCYSIDRTRQHIAEHKRRAGGADDAPEPCKGKDFDTMLAGMYREAGIEVPDDGGSLTDFMDKSTKPYNRAVAGQDCFG